jgi:DDE_Tnp_1-associated/Carboxypeptidase A inhibitor
VEKNECSTTATGPRTLSLLGEFADLSEQRIDRCKVHALIGVIASAILAMICEADYSIEMEEFGKRKETCAKTFLKLKNDAPTDDTFCFGYCERQSLCFSGTFCSLVQAEARAAREQSGRQSKSEHPRLAHSLYVFE